MSCIQHNICLTQKKKKKKDHPILPSPQVLYHPVHLIFGPCQLKPYESANSLPSSTGHDKYYNKYINVKKGGIGGIAMLLTGYIAMSYLWEYDHLSKCHCSIFIGIFNGLPGWGVISAVCVI